MKKPIIIILAMMLVCSISGCEAFSIDRTEEDGIEEAGIENQAQQPEPVEPEPIEEEAKEAEEASLGQDISSLEESNIQKRQKPLEDSDPEIDIDTARQYFQEGIRLFEEEDYLLSEYYFNQIKDDYPVLEDHVYYYLAKSLLFQEKYELSEGKYRYLLDFLSDSIFYEKALLEFADLAFITGDYLTAEPRYKIFLENYPDSELYPYALNQYAVCMQRNQKPGEAIESYKTLYLGYPLSEYAEDAYVNIRYIEDTEGLEPFMPSNEEILDRAEIFFEAYSYNLAIEEYLSLLEDDSSAGTLTEEQQARIFFKLGMCYYNLRDYNLSRDYLDQGYSGYPGSSYADDYLYFLGRAYTNLDDDNRAIEHYDRLLADHPNSNYADDALYRKGRIFFFRDDFTNALANYQKILESYPAGDRTREAYWESGWIQYSSGDYASAQNTFDSMASSFSGTSLSEKALFWKAKCLEKAGDSTSSRGILRSIASSDSYSYYVFASAKILESIGEEYQIPPLDTQAYPHNPELESVIPEVFDGLERSQSGDYGTISHIDKAKELLSFGFYESASKELERGADEIEESPVDILQVSTLYLRSKDYINSQRIISKNYDRLKANLSGSYIDYFYYLLYPYGYKELVDHYSSVNGVDPLFTLAVIREESRFQPDAGSFAGALGLMQIIPSTGQGIATALGISSFDTSILLDPETSIKMGTYYLSQQLDNFDGNKYFACGAYNGGPGAMGRWINENWNGDIDEFIENISYDETRNYVKKVMGSYYFYSMIY